MAEQDRSNLSYNQQLIDFSPAIPQTICKMHKNSLNVGYFRNYGVKEEKICKCVVAFPWERYQHNMLTGDNITTFHGLLRFYNNYGTFESGRCKRSWLNPPLLVGVFNNFGTLVIHECSCCPDLSQKVYIVILNNCGTIIRCRTTCQPENAPSGAIATGPNLTPSIWENWEQMPLPASNNLLAHEEQGKPKEMKLVKTENPDPEPDSLTPKQRKPEQPDYLYLKKWLLEVITENAELVDLNAMSKHSIYGDLEDFEPKI